MTGRNTPPAVRKTKGLRNSREEPPHPRWRKEAGGGARGKLSPREATLSHPANRRGFLSKDFLRSYRRPRREKAHRSRGRARTNPWLPGALATEGQGTPHPGRTRANLWPPEPLAAEGKGRRAAAGERAPKLLATWPEHCECSPHIATSACSALPSPQQD